MSAVVIVVGLALVVLAISDLFSTTLSVTSVNGIVSGRVADFVWRRVLRLRLSHPALRMTGMSIVVGLIATWALAIWIGWTLVFIGAGDAVVESSTRAPASISDRAFFAGYLVSTLGNGDFTADGTVWQLTAVLASLSGLIAVTLAVTFLVPVAQGVVHRRQLATTIYTLGETPRALLERSWNGSDFSMLGTFLPSLLSEIHLLTQRHMAYPVLHYFHSVDRHAAVAPMLAVLDESLLLLRRGARNPGIDALTLDASRASVDELLRLLEQAFVYPAAAAPPGPELAWLRKIGAETVDATEFAHLLESESPRRRVLHGFVEADGWSWDEVVDVDDEARPDVGWTTADRDGEG